MATSSSPLRDDRVFRETRWLAAIIIPFLLVAFYILYLRPTETKELFAWEIAVPMTAMMLGAAYIGGAYFFARAITAQRWHWFGMGLLPVTAFASCMGIATILHWDKFSHDHISFVTWVILYFTTPFLVIATWLRNRRTDPHTPDANDVVLPRGVQYALGGLGAAMILVSILLFISPDFMIRIWPWPLTPLTARVVGGMFALPGVLGVVLAIDGRWSSARILVQSQVVSVAFIVIAATRDWSHFDTAKITTWIFIIGMVGLLILLPALHMWMDKRRTSTGA